MRSRLVRIAVLAGLVTGCDNAASRSLITAPIAASLEVGSVPVVVSGAGHIEAGDGLRNFTFHAIEHPDGSVSGSYQILRTDLGTGFRVDVTCLSVVGNGAWVAGIIASSTQPGVVEGTVSYFYAFDNGEGSNANADIVSIARINDAPGKDVEFCTTHPQVLPPRNVQMGNVQIR